MIAIDFETDLISNESPIPSPVCLSWHNGKDSGLIIGMLRMENFLRSQFEANRAILAHNAVFETLVIHTYFPALRPLLWEHIENGGFICTQLYQQLLDNVSKKECFNKSLSALVLIYFNEDISEEKKDPEAWRLRYSELRGLLLADWPQRAVDYAINDSIWAYKLYIQQKKIKNIPFKEHMKAAFALNLIASRGLLVDQDRVKILSDELDAILNPVYAELEELGFMNRSKAGKLSKNVKKLKEHVLANFKVLVKSPKGGICCDSEAMDAYLVENPDDEILKKFRYIGKYEKTKTAFVSRLKTANPVIRTGYNAIVRSGRTSSRASSLYPSANLQQMPRALDGVTWDVRECMIARPGYKLVCIDFNNLELISVAKQLHNTYGSSAMLDIINSGDVPTDLHTVLACKLMSKQEKRYVSYEEFLKNKKLPEYKAYRNKGKPVSLGLPGGMGYDTIRIQFNKAGIGLKYAELAKFSNEFSARRMLKKYESEYPDIRVRQSAKFEWTLVLDEIVGLKKTLFELYPELEMFLKRGHEKNLTGDSKRVKNKFDEWEEEPFYKYNFNGVMRDFCNYTAFCNGFLMQSPSAAGAKNCVWKAAKEFEMIDNEEVNLLAFIHDEIIFEIKDNENLRKNIDKCAEIMIDGMQEILKGVRVAVEAEINDYWSKTENEYAISYFKNANENELRLI